MFFFYFVVSVTCCVSWFMLCCGVVVLVVVCLVCFGWVVSCGFLMSRLRIACVRVLVL